MEAAAALLPWRCIPLERRALAELLLGQVSGSRDGSVARAREVLLDEVIVNLRRRRVALDGNVRSEGITRAEDQGRADRDRSRVRIHLDIASHLGTANLGR